MPEAVRLDVSTLPAPDEHEVRSTHGLAVELQHPAMLPAESRVQSLHRVSIWWRDGDDPRHEGPLEPAEGLAASRSGKR
jgi:hypothetical protein